MGFQHFLMPYLITVDMLLLLYSIEELKIRSNLFLGFFHGFHHLFLRFSHNVQKSENVQIYTFCKFNFHISWRQNNELIAMVMILSEKSRFVMIYL